MHKIDGAKASVTQPAISPVGSVPNGFFTSGTNDSVLPTRVDVDFLNAIQNELCAVLAAAGISPDKTKQDQLSQAIAVLAGGGSLSFTYPLSANLTVLKIFTLSGDVKFNPASGQALKVSTKLVTSKVSDSSYGNYLEFTGSTIDLFPTGSGFNLTASGLRGASGARITTVASTIGTSNTASINQNACKTYIDAFKTGEHSVYMTGYTESAKSAPTTTYISRGLAEFYPYRYPATVWGSANTWQVVYFSVNSTVDPITSYDFRFYDGTDDILLCSLNSGEFSKTVTGPFSLATVPQSAIIKMVLHAGAATTGRISYSLLMRRVL